MKIPFSPPDITEKEIEQVSEALRSGMDYNWAKDKRIRARGCRFMWSKSCCLS